MFDLTRIRVRWARRQGDDGTGVSDRRLSGLGLSDLGLSDG